MEKTRKLLLLAALILIGALANAQTAKDLYNRGYKAYGEKNYSVAINLLSQSAQLDPSDIDTWYYLGQAYDDVDRFAEAIDAFKRGVAAGDTRFCAFMIGLEYEYGSGVTASREEAAKWYRMAANAGSDSAAKKLQEWGMVNGPVAQLEYPYTSTATAASGGNARDLYDRGYKAYNDKNYGEAISLLSQSAQLDPSDIDTWYYLGQAYDSAKRYTEAIDAFQRGVAAGDTRFCAFMIGLEHEYGCGVPASREEAAKWYRMAANAGDDSAAKKLQEWGMVNGPMPTVGAATNSYSSQPSTSGMSAKELWDLGFKAHQDKRYQESIDLINQALAIEPTKEWWWHIQGDNYRAIKDFPNAYNCYINTCKNGDERSGAFYIALMYRFGSGGCTKNIDEAVRWYRLAAQKGSSTAVKSLNELGQPLEGPIPDIYGSNVSVATVTPASGMSAKELWDLGFKAHQDKRYQESIDLINQALAQKPDNSWWWYIQAENYEELDNGQKAVECYLEAYRNGDDSLAPFSIGLLYEYGKCGVTPDRDKAIKWYKITAKTEDNDGPARKKLREWGVQL